MWENEYQDYKVQKKLKLDIFFADERNFPWDLLGIDYPRSAETHLYLCKILSRYGGVLNTFLMGRPLMKELEKFASDPEGPDLIKRIYVYCEQLYDEMPSRRRDRATEVLEFLSRTDEFCQDMESKLIEFHHMGKINLDKDLFLSKSDYKKPTW